MNMTKRIVLTILILVLSIGLGIATLYFATNGTATKAGPMASAMGAFFAIIAVVEIGALWLPWAIRTGQQKRNSQSHRKNKK